MAGLARIGVLAHPFRPQTFPLAKQVGHDLRQHGIETWVETVWHPSGVRAKIEQSDMMIAIGGDGAMFRAARECARFGVPILGINAGHLGFLTEISPDEWPTTEERILTGKYWLEDHMMLTAKIYQNDQCIATAPALNDVVIGRGATARSVWLEAHIDDSWAATYNADALIVATPTGSTAYALAVGGPILPPELRNILVVPVAPHLSMDRPLVLAEGAQVKVVVLPRNHEVEVAVTVDGEQVAMLDADDYVLIETSEQTTRFVRLRERGYFYRSILDRLEPRLAIRNHDSD